MSRRVATQRPRKISSGLRAASVIALMLALACATSLPPEAQPPRQIPLAETLNTRDLGGYRVHHRGR